VSVIFLFNPFIYRKSKLSLYRAKESKKSSQYTKISDVLPPTKDVGTYLDITNNKTKHL